MTIGRPLRVLFIVGSFPPAGGSAVQRQAKFAKYLESFNCRVHVLTERDFRATRDESMLGEIPASVKVHRAFSLEPDCLHKKIEDTFVKHSVRGRFLNVMLKIYSVLYYRIVMVDWTIGWVPFAIRKGEEIIEKENIDVIFALHDPPTPFLVGYHLKKKYGLPLVIDYSDPWTTDPFYPEGNWIGRLNKSLCVSLESRCLKSADSVVYCKQSTYDTVMEQFEGLDRKKFVLIPNGYDLEDFRKQDRNDGSHPFRIVYTGKLTNRYCYSPRSFFSALKALLEEKVISAGEVEVLLAGIASQEHLDLIGENGLQKIVRHLGYLDHEKSTELVQSADALLLIVESPLGRAASEAYSGSMPAKIFEYLCTGKPILGIVPEGAEADILRKSRLGLIARSNDLASVKRALAELLGRRGSEQHPDPDWDFIRTFDRRLLAGQLASVFHGVSSSPGRIGAGENRLARAPIQA